LTSKFIPHHNPRPLSLSPLLSSSQPPNSTARQQIQSRVVQTPHETIHLDAEPDVREILLLSDEFKLDELLSLACIQAARQEREIVSAAAAAGILLEERRALLTTLWVLMQAQLMSAEALPRELLSIITAFNAQLLSTPLIDRLIELIQSSPAMPSEHSQLTVVIDSAGRHVDRLEVAQRETTLLCECLVYALWNSQQRVGASQIVQLMHAQRHLSLKLASTPSRHHQQQQHGDIVTSHQVCIVTFALLLALLPTDAVAGDGAALQADEDFLAELAKDATLESAVSTIEINPVTELAYGLLLSMYGPDTATDRAWRHVSQGIKVGALGWLGSRMMSSSAMEDEPDHQRQLYACIANQLLINFLDAQAGRKAVEELIATSIKKSDEELQAGPEGWGQHWTTAPHSSSSMALDIVVANGPGAAAGTSASSQMTMMKSDTLATLLSAFAAVYRAHPDLFLDESLRCALVPEFMQYVIAHEVLTERKSPSAFLALLSIMTSLASGAEGARSMFAQLRTTEGTDASPVSWKAMFQLLIAVIQRYSLTENVGDVRKRSLEAEPLNPWDAAALVSYINLFKRVMSEGSPDEVASWLGILEDEAGGISPLWEILFQAMCSPVPQSLKAALDDAIASLARRPDLSAALMDRLLTAVVVQPLSPESVPRYDLTYQLTEIEARSEDYQEVIAFVRLLNILWTGMGSQLPDEGRPYSHLSRFVREEALAAAPQRAYRDEAQKWDLLTLCMEHAEETIKSVQSWSMLGSTTMMNGSSGGGGRYPPGLDALLDLLGERGLMRALRMTALSDVDQAAHERKEEPWGAAKETSVLAGLRLMSTSLRCDAEFVAAASRANRSGSYETLDTVLRHDRRCLGHLLNWIKYPHNPAIQAEVIVLTHLLVLRMPNIVSLALSVPSSVHTVSLSQQLQDGYASCLNESLFNISTSLSILGSASSSSSSLNQPSDDDPRAALILQLLLDGFAMESASQYQPSLTHLLCGFDIDPGMSPMMVLAHPRSQATVLSVVLSALETPRLSWRKPRLYEHCLELVHELAAEIDAGPAILELLRMYHSNLLPILVSLCGEDTSVVASNPSGLHQRAWFLRILVLLLHRADAAIPQHQESIEQILATLLLLPSEQQNGSSRVSSSNSNLALPIATELLQMAVEGLPEPPRLAPTASADVRRILQELDAETLLSADFSPGNWTVSSRGDPLYNVSILKNAVLQRYSEYVGRHGTSNDALKEGGKTILQFAQEHNAWVEAANGHAALVDAWQALVLVAFSRRFDLLAGMVGPSEPMKLLLDATEAALTGVENVLSSSHGAQLAVPLCGAIQALMARLQEQSSLGGGAGMVDPSSALPIPERSVSLLKHILSSLWKGHNIDAVRPPLYGALVSYVSMCKGPSVLRAPTGIVQIVGETIPGGIASLAQLDSLQSKLEEANSAVLYEAAGGIMEVIATDATSTSPAMVTTALSALTSILTADPSGVVANEVYSVGLPARLLIDLESEPLDALNSLSSQGQAMLLAAEARLNLLLCLVLGGPPAKRSAAAQRLFSLQAIPRLGRCQALSIQPEEPGMGTMTSNSNSSNNRVSMRQWLYSITTPLLRVVLALSHALPESGPLREQMVEFVDMHVALLARILHDASSPGVRGWEPSDAELEEAGLILQLLSEVAPDWRSIGPATSQLQEAVYRCASRFLCLSAKSMSPVVVRLVVAKDSGHVSAKDKRTEKKVLALRCALAQFIRELVHHNSDTVVFRALPADYGAGASMIPTLSLFKDALLQSSQYDLPELVSSIPTLLDGLKSALLAGGRSEKLMATSLSRSASGAQGDVSKMLFYIEQLLAVVYHHLHKAGDEKLGTVKDMEQLKRLLEPVITHLERYVGGVEERPRLGAVAEMSSMKLLLRRIQGFLRN